MTTTTRRMGVEGAETRTLLVEATEALLREEGYNSVSARQVAAKAGIKPQLVYYYFRTMDELILAVVRRVHERRAERFQEALASSKPLHAIWAMSSDPGSARLSAEVTSLIGHRDTIRAEVNKNGEDFRALQIAEVARLLREKGVDEQAYPADALVMMMTALGRTMVTEAALGFSVGHAGAAALVERVLAQLEG